VLTLGHVVITDADFYLWAAILLFFAAVVLAEPKPRPEFDDAE
jgi:hypothetical protein